MPKKIAVDLDGTLAHYESGQYPEIGKPVSRMMKRVRKWIDDGNEVIIFTARASGGQKDIDQIEHWLKQNGLEGLEVTCTKTIDIDEFWDDKAVQVIPNTGECISNERMQENWACELDMKPKRPTNIFHELEKGK